VVRVACSSGDGSGALPAYAAIRTRIPPQQDAGLMLYFAHCFPIAMRQCWGRPFTASSAAAERTRHGEPTPTFRLHWAADPHESLVAWQPARVAYVTVRLTCACHFIQIFFCTAVLRSCFIGSAPPRACARLTR
jgi:hypothetical protein